ncbi:MAG TPA: hypothetical protein VHN98_08700, partial [Acidimicrobiales bacterium]|nr:hypothetical protein [Acidimicrobiales bacterium]
MTEQSLVVQTLAYAALDALRLAIPLDLCAYLHEADGAGPQLYLRAPDLSSLDASKAFDLFTALRDALDRITDDDAPTTTVAGFRASAVVTRGTASRGLFVLGRRETALDPREAAAAEEIGRAMGDACHTIEAAGDSRSGTPEPRSVGVQVTDGVVRATVTLATRTGRVEGRGEARATGDAVAGAVLDAVAPDVKLADVTEGTVAGERIVLVLVRD